MAMAATLLLAPLLHATASATCPGSTVPVGSPHDSVEVRVTFGRDVCGAVRNEVLARVHGKGSWRDPHSRHGPGTQGRYTLLGEEEDGTIRLSRSTADGLYTDLLNLQLAPTASASGCIIEACSESQVVSVSDFSTNYCNVHDLYCGLADGCPFAGAHNLEYDSE